MAIFKILWTVLYVDQMTKDAYQKMTRAVMKTKIPTAIKGTALYKNAKSAN